MTKHPRPYVTLSNAYKASTTLWIQAPLPTFARTLPILLSIEGQGSGWQGPPPLAPPEEPANG